MRMALLMLLVGCAPAARWASEDGGLSDGPTLYMAAVHQPGGTEVDVLWQRPQGAQGELMPPAIDEQPLEELTRDEFVDADQRITTVRYLVPTSTERQIVLGACIRVPGADPTCADRLFVDPEGPPPRPEMVDITEPGAIVRIWPIVLGAMMLGALLATLRWLWPLLPKRSPRKKGAAGPAQSPAELALSRWQPIFDDSTMDPYDKALALSEIFRGYLESTFRFPALSWTTTESLKHLQAQPHMQGGLLPRASRLLRATDRVKYADESTTEELFQRLDDDLRLFISNTRPTMMREEEGA